MSTYRTHVLVVRSSGGVCSNCAHPLRNPYLLEHEALKRRRESAVEVLSQHDANLKVTVGPPDGVVVWIARFLHAAREAIHTSGAFSGTRRYISNTVGGRGFHWIAVVVSVETVNNPP